MYPADRLTVESILRLCSSTASALSNALYCGLNGPRLEHNNFDTFATRGYTSDHTLTRHLIPNDGRNDAPFETVTQLGRIFPNIAKRLPLGNNPERVAWSPASSLAHW